MMDSERSNESLSIKTYEVEVDEKVRLGVNIPNV